MRILCLFTALLITIVPKHASAEVMTGYTSISNQLTSFDLSTGVITNVGSMSGAILPFSLTYHNPTDSLLSIDAFGDRLLSTNPVTGNGTVLGSTNIQWNFYALEYDPLNDTLWASQGTDLYTIDTSTGAGNLVGRVTTGGENFSGNIQAIAVNPTDGEMYFTGFLGGTINLYHLNSTSLEASLISTKSTTSSPGWTDIAFAQNGELYGLGTDNRLWRIGTGAGDATLTNIDFSSTVSGSSLGLAFRNVSAVPEPSSLTFLGLAVCGLAARLKHKRRRSVKMGRLSYLAS